MEENFNVQEETNSLTSTAKPKGKIFSISSRIDKKAFLTMLDAIFRLLRGLPFINHQIKRFITRFLIKLSPTQIIY